MHKVEIPDEIVATCRALAQAAIKAGLSKFSEKFEAYCSPSWNGEVSFSWEAGRHNSSGHEFRIALNSFCFATITDPKTTAKDE